MRTKNRLEAKDSKYYKPEITHCPKCSEKLVYCHPVWRKTISTLEGEVKVINLGYRCDNETCSNDTTYRSAQAEHISMKHITYGMDVIANIGYLRFQEHKTRTEIMEILNEKQVKISDRQVQKLYERYALLLRANAKENAEGILNHVVKEHGGIILSIDGVQPEKGNETLYVIREVLSGTVLAAKNLKSSASTELMELIKPVMDWGFPIQAFVSDGQQSIRLAIEKLAPTIPYQYCQFHYFKDIAKPLVEKDRKLKTNIKKKLRGIRAVERKIDQMGTKTHEAEIAEDYIAAIRSVLLDDGKPPFDLPGMRVYERSKAIKTSMEKCRDKKGDYST
ncbi:transposase [Evansella tamaricis]|uniref:Transposase n=1 Tax=Evansella tamaricis TaxID=2069301 RepID=A0ABS6JC95_9BACI|nr:transposase [Evansella tamaricis]MBU9711030.1 transposase [Evansella tamaricis]MBU9711123.1 transposase [Evansella tamaricis]MBU9712403.1 transposase [Evansella tamaricis]